MCQISSPVWALQNKWHTCNYLVIPLSVQYYLQGIIIQLTLERENNVLLPQRHSLKCFEFTLMSFWIWGQRVKRVYVFSCNLHVLLGMQCQSQCLPLSLAGLNVTIYPVGRLRSLKSWFWKLEVEVGKLLLPKIHLTFL